MESLYLILMCSNIEKIKRYYVSAFGFEDYEHPEFKNCIIKFNTIVVLKKSEFNMEEHDRLLYINVSAIDDRIKEIAVKHSSGLYKAIDPDGNIIIIEKIADKDEYEKIGIILRHDDIVTNGILSKLAFDETDHGYRCDIHLSVVIIWYVNFYTKFNAKINRDFGAALSLMLAFEY